MYGLNIYTITSHARILLLEPMYYHEYLCRLHGTVVSAFVCWSINTTVVSLHIRSPSSTLKLLLSPLLFSALVTFAFALFINYYHLTQGHIASRTSTWRILTCATCCVFVCRPLYEVSVCLEHSSNFHISPQSLGLIAWHWQARSGVDVLVCE